MSTLLIKNGVIVTLGQNNKVLYDSAVLVQDGIVKKIGPKEEFKAQYDKVIDAHGKVVLPGFINAHMHFYSTFARGLGKAAPSKDFMEVLKNLWWRLDKKLTLKDCYYSTLVMLLSAIRHGTTTLIDHHASPGAVKGSLQEVAKAVKESGLRASLCYELSDRDGEEISKQGIEENVEFFRYCKENKNDYLKSLFGLHASFTINDKTMETVGKLGAELGTGFHIHAAEADSDENYNLEHFDMRVIERLEKYGILGPKTITAHCVHVNEHEMDILAKTGTIVVHNPQSNMNNAVGVADIIKMQSKGILVGLGTDAMTVNMMEELRVALWAQHLSQQNPSCGFMEAASALLFNNAKIVNKFWDIPLGSIDEGAAGDIVLIDYFTPTPFNEQTILGHIVFGISQSAVDTTIVGGKVLMENKKLTLNIDEEKLAYEANELATALWDRF